MRKSFLLTLLIMLLLIPQMRPSLDLSSCSLLQAQAVGGEPSLFAVWNKFRKRKDKETGAILGSARLKYWELHNNGDEKALSLIGLSPQH